MKIESKRVEIKASAEKTYGLVSNFNNFGSSLPPEVKNWQSTENNCSFEISGMAKINIEIIDKKPFRSVTYKATANQPIGMVLVGNIEEEGTSCFATIVLEADVPMALSMMMKKPLEKFVDVLIDKVKEVAERED
jgi:hypothetical protein